MYSSFFPKLVVNLSAIKNNYLYIKNICDMYGITCSAVVKADSYGLGAINISSMLYNEVGCRDFWTAHIEEAIKLREKALIKNNANIFYFQGFHKSHIDIIKHYALIPVINSIDDFHNAKNNNLSMVIHVDTGLNRIGIRDTTPILEDLGKEKIKYIISHLACTNSSTFQKNKFDEILKNISKDNHIKAGISASAGTFLGRDFLYDIVRPGAFLYGINFPSYTSKNVLTIMARVIQKYKVPAGTSIGYDAIYTTTNKETKIAAISIGYADGINRNFHQNGKIMFYDQSGIQYKAKILGAISMDILMCDVTDIPDRVTEVYQYAYILDDNYTINDMANDVETTPYEILTNFKLGNRFI